MPVINESTDAAANTSTAYSISAGDYFFGTVEGTTAADWIEVSLTAGQIYTFGLVGVGALNDSVDDTYLRLRDSAGIQIDFDDDDGPGLYSTITFTAATTGTYYLDVQSYGASAGGDYGLSMVLGDRASYDVTMGAGALLRPDASWAATPGTGATVTWGIRATGPASDASGASAPFSVLSAAQIAAAQTAVAMFDGVSGLTLTQVNPGGTTDNATLLFGGYTSATDGAGAYAYYPGSTAASSNSGDLWLNNQYVSTTSLPVGSYSFFVMLHEMGHSVGLAHPGDYNAAPGTSITYANNAQFIEDSHQYSVMSYFDESNTTTSVGGYPDTLLLYDIYALQQQYGADVTFNAGNTTYGFNATVGGAYDFTTNTNPLLSIWDGGGTDTLDLSGYSMDQTISLEAGTFSSVGGYSGNLSIAIGAVIENAVGGSGNDTITGNSADNAITGNDGTDTFVMNLNRSAVAITVISGGYQAVSSLGTDTLYGVEFIQFNDQLLDLSTITGGGPTTGDDTLTGTNAADTISLLAGNDSYSGLGGNDSVLGNSGDDTLQGGLGDDTLLGGSGSDVMNGDDGDDRIQIWTSNAGDLDIVDGGTGNADVLDFSGFGSAVWVWLGYKNAEAWTKDTADAAPVAGPWRAIAEVTGVENLTGTAFDDWLQGDAGNNMLQGGAGDDTLLGDDGDDRIQIWTSNVGDLDIVDGGTGNADVLDFSGFGSAVWVWLGYKNAEAWTKDTADAAPVAGPWRAIAEVTGVENLTGTAFDDWLQGDAGNNDLTGGGGSDTFVFADGHGADRIMDFEATNDAEKIDLSGIAAITDFTDLWNNRMSQSGADVVIDTGTGSITLIGVQLSDLQDGTDFVF